LDLIIIFYENNFYIELSPLYSKLGVGLFNPKPDDYLCNFGDAVVLMFNLVLLHNYYSVSNFLFLLSGFLITGCNLFFILVKPFLASIDEVMLVLDTSDTRLSFFYMDGVLKIAGEIEDGVKLSSSISMKSLFLSKDVITLNS